MLLLAILFFLLGAAAWLRAWMTWRKCDAFWRWLEWSKESQKRAEEDTARLFGSRDGARSPSEVDE